MDVLKPSISPKNEQGLFRESIMRAELQEDSQGSLREADE
jgi:hypothetical protein